MTSLIAERPIIVALALGVLAAAMIYGWLQSGRKPLAIFGLVLLGLIPISFWIAQRWVTDREQIENLIYRTAESVEANDHEAVLELIADQPTRRQAAMELPRYEFTTARVASIRDITILNEAVPPQADVDLNVKVEVSDKRGAIKNLRVPRRLMLTMEKRVDAEHPDGRWLVTGYQHMPIVGQPDGFTTQPIQ